MTKYRTFGKLDDQFVTEGDTFFTRMNARLRPNQLQPGEVALSKNGRMNEDGTWQTRKGLSTLFGSITSGADSIRRKGLSTLFGSITSGADSIRLPWVATSAQRQSGIVTIVLNAKPSLSFIPGDNITVAEIDSSVNGTHALASVNFNTNTITFANAGSDTTFSVQGEGVGNTSVVQTGNSITTTLNFTLADDEVNEVYGSAVFSDPNSNSDDYVFTPIPTAIRMIMFSRLPTTSRSFFA